MKHAAADSSSSSSIRKTKNMKIYCTRHVRVQNLFNERNMLIWSGEYVHPYIHSKIIISSDCKWLFSTDKFFCLAHFVGL